MLSLKEWASLEYHNTLNPKLWDGDDELLPEVKAHLKQIEKDFISFLKIDKSIIIDTYLTGSNCNYQYSKLSDIDMHLMCRYDPNAVDSTGKNAQDVFNTYRNLYNSSHKLFINGIPIETYVAPISETVTSDAGVYALNAGKWINKPIHGDKIVYDVKTIKAKAEPLKLAINDLIKGNATEKAIHDVKSKIWQYRAEGLYNGGEMSTGNLVFKSVRNQGYLQKLLDYEKKQQDKSLSL